MTIGRNVGGITTAREAKYPAGAQMIRNVINSSMQREVFDRTSQRILFIYSASLRLAESLSEGPRRTTASDFGILSSTASTSSTLKNRN